MKIYKLVKMIDRLTAYVLIGGLILIGLADACRILWV